MLVLVLALGVWGSASAHPFWNGQAIVVETMRKTSPTAPYWLVSVYNQSTAFTCEPYGSNSNYNITDMAELWNYLYNAAGPYLRADCNWQYYNGRDHAYINNGLDGSWKMMGETFPWGYRWDASWGSCETSWPCAYETDALIYEYTNMVTPGTWLGFATIVHELGHGALALGDFHPTLPCGFDQHSHSVMNYQCVWGGLLARPGLHNLYDSLEKYNHTTAGWQP